MPTLFQAYGLTEPAPEPTPAPEPSRTVLGTAGDVGLSLLKGAIAVPEAAVGITDLVTGGRAGQAAEAIGFRPREAREMLDEAYSDPQREAFRRVQDADGFIGTAVEALRNPSVIGHSILESLPLMGAGGVVGRGAIAAAPRIAPAAGAIGEGTVAAGSAAEQIRQQSPDGRLTGEQAALSGAAGLATGAFGFLGAKVANRLGIADVDTMLAGAQKYPQVRQGVTRRILEGALSEGVLEELPQSISEQVLQNLATGKPLDEGVDQAAVLGLLSGAAMGGGFNAFRGGQAQAQPGPQNDAGAPIPPAGSDVPPPAPAEAGGILSPRGDPLAGNPGFDVNRTLVERGREADQDRRLDEGLDAAGFDARQRMQDELQSQRVWPVKQMERRLLDEAKPDLDTVDALMKAGSKSAADALKKSIDKKIAAKLSDLEVQALASVDPRWGGKDFATLYMEKRREGANQGDAAGHAATLAATLQLAKHAGMSDKAIAATYQKARGLELDEIPDFVERAMQGLADRGIGKPMQGIAQALAGYRDEAILAAGNALLKEQSTPAAQADTVSPAEPVVGAVGNSAAALPHVTAAGSASSSATVDDGAHLAATSPRNDTPEPTKGQILAGNAKLGHTRVGPLQISIENPAGSVREDKNNDPPKWRTPMNGAHYGYVKRTEGADGDHVDVFVKEGTPEDWDGPVYVVDQVNPKTGRFDEHKAVIGSASAEEASDLYHRHYERGWKGARDITEFPSVAAFNAWVKDGTKKDKPVADLLAPEAAPATAPAPVPADVGEVAGVQPRADGADRPDGATEQPDAALKEPTTAAEADAAWEAAKASGDSARLQQAAAWVRQFQKPVEVEPVAEKKPEALPAVKQRLFVQRGSQRFEVASIEEAAQKWMEFRDQTAEGVSAVGNGVRVVDQDGKEVARIAYNGNVFPAGEWKPGVKPLLEANNTTRELAPPKSTPRPDGTLKIEGDPKALKEQLKAAGVDKVMTAKDGVVVGKSQVEKAKKAIAPAVSEEEAEFERKVAASPSDYALGFQRDAEPVSFQQRGMAQKRIDNDLPKPHREAVRIVASGKGADRRYWIVPTFAAYTSRLAVPARERAAAEAERKAAPVESATSGAAAPLYASRPVTNAADIIAWAKEQGFKTTLPAEDMHVTIAYSSAPMDGAKMAAAPASVNVPGGKRSVEPLGDKGAVVLKIASKALSDRWQAYRDAGASWDYDGYTPHITITYDGSGVDLSKVEPYTGPITLGPEKQEALNVDKADEYVEKPTEEAPKAQPEPTKAPAAEKPQPAKPAAAEPSPAPEAAAQEGKDAEPAQFSLRGITPEQRAENFRRWSNNAPLVTSAAANTYSFKSGQKVVLEAFHGAKRPDRIGTVFKRSRATSGPMAFFTSAPDLASSYAQGKDDTSLNLEETPFETWFKYKPQGERSPVDIVRAWYRLDEATKAKIAALAPRIQNDDTAENIILGPEGNTTGNGGYDIREARGNPLKALVTAWLESGSIFGSEQEFMDVLRLAGFPVKDVTYDSPNAEYPSVFKVFVFMQKPLVTSDIPQDVRDALQAAAKRDRSRAQQGGADMWDKNTRTLREWVENFSEREATDAAYVWTSIPDKVTEVFKSLGYDGIIDWSGKGGGHQHPVYIPFSETQVKSATGNKGTFDGGKKDIRFSLRDQQEDQSLSYEEVEKIVDELTAKWQNRPDIRVLDSMSEAPPVVLKTYLEQRSQGAAGRIHGFHLKGTVYLVADSMAKPEDVQTVLWHESLGHFGLRGHFGDALRPMLADVILGQREKVIAKAKAYGLDMNKQADRLMAAEEVLAELAQSRPELGVIRRLVAAIRTWLRDNITAFAKMKMTDDELIRKFILPARGFVERGQSPRPTFTIMGDEGPETVFSLGDNPSVTNEIKDAIQAWTGQAIAKAAPEMVRARTLKQLRAALADTAMSDEAKHQLAYNALAKAQEFVPASGKFGSGPTNAEISIRKALVKRAAVGGRHDPVALPWRGKFAVVLDGKVINTAATMQEAEESAEFMDADFWRGEMGDGGKYQNWSESPASDPEDNRVQFSLADTAPDYLKAARQAVADSITAPGTISWWSKTVGTPYHLAQKHPEFKRVFDRVQDFLGDVSAFATEAADRAPTILPKLETWKDILKTAISAEDTKAVGRPVWEGTLMWVRGEDGKPVPLSEKEAEAQGMKADEKAQEMLRRGLLRENVLKMWQGLPLEQFQANVETRYRNVALKAGIVWTDAELKSMFNLDARQIGLYREFRAAVDHSITQLALSDMLRYAGKDADEEIRRQVLDSGDLKAASEMLRDHLIDRAKEDPDRNDLLLETAERVIAKADQARDLIEAGYAPLMRFGSYTVDVVDEGGNRLYFGLFETRGEAATMARHMQEEYPSASIRRGTVSNEEYKLFAGVSPETLELFGEMLGMESTGDAAKDKAFQEYLKLAKTNRSAMRRLIHRKGIAGFSEDVGRVLAGFVYSNARQSSANLHMGEIGDAANAIPQGQGQLKDQAVKLAEYVKNPQEEAHGIRGLLFAQYLGGSLAAAMVNMTQPVQVTMPYLSQFGGIKQSASQMKRALADVWKKSTGEADLDAALKRAVEEGIVAPQEVHQLMAQAMGRGSLKAGDGTKAGTVKAIANNAGSRLALAWGKFFSAAELFNRRVTFIAAYRIAKAQKMTNPAEFAEKAVNETQFVYNKGNRPNWARGAVGSVLFTFKTYSISYLELMQRMYASGPEGKKAALFGMAMLLLMGGAGGLPFAEDVSDVIDGIGQRMGYNFSVKRARQQLLRDVLGEALGDFAEKGVSGLPGAPIDVAGRLGMGNLIPGTGIFTKKPDHTRDVLEVVGPAGDFAQRVARGIDLFGQGRPLSAALEASPTAARNLAQSWEMATTGEYRDRMGRKVLETDTADAVAKAIGFQPGAVAKVQDASRDAQALVNVARLRESEIAAAWAKAIVDKDEDGRNEAREAVAEWNRKNPDTPIRISLGQIMRRVQNMRMSKAERIEKSAPREIRQAARRELEQSR